MKKLIILAVVLPFTVMAQNPQSGPANMPDMGELFLQQLDENGDGKVTLDEFRKPTDENFQIMDRDKNGEVTAEEARNFARVMMQRQHYMQQQMSPRPNLPR